MNKSNRPIRKFNPGTFQSDEEVIEQFVVRKHELNIVLEVLRGNIDSPSCQHVMVVAPRGRGKTMLLARVAAELRTDHELSGHLFPVRFMEESQEIFNLVDFWLDTLFHLARESVKHDPILADELQETHAALTARWREETLEQHAQAAVLDAADRLGKKLVLMVENLQALCRDEDFGWKLRGALQSEPQIMLLATATSRFKGLDDAEQPFFELFRIVDLEPLVTEECRRLWQVVSGDVVSGREIRPLEILTGGSPRLLVIVSGFAQHLSLHQLMEELVKLIDDHTEYFRGHLEVLAKNERRVYLSVIDLWQPSNTGEISVRARMDVRPVSTLLGRLVNRGAVIAEGSGKKRLYTAAERLYSIYYKLRRERDEAAIVANLIHFMAVFYSKAELAEMSGKLIVEATRLPAIREGIERAIAEQPQFSNLFPSMTRPSIDRASNPATAIDNESVKRLLKEITTAFNKGAFEKVIEIMDQTFTVRSANWSRVPEPSIALAFSYKATAYEKLGEFVAAIATYDELIERFGDSDEPKTLVPVAWALSKRGDLQRQLDEFVEAIATYDELIERFGDSNEPKIQVPVAWALSKKGDLQGQLDEFVAAIATYDELIERFGDSDEPKIQVPVAWTRYDKATAYEKLGEFVAAIATCNELIERFGDSDEPKTLVPVAWALSKRGDLQRQLDEFVEAIATYDELIERFGDSNEPKIQVPVAWALSKKGDLQGQLDEFVAAIATYDELIERFGDSNEPKIQVPVAWTLSDKGDVQGQLDEFVEAIATYDELIERFGDSDEPDIQVPIAGALYYKGMRQIEMGRAEDALNACEELERSLGALTDNDKSEFTWRAIWVRTKALLIQEQHQAALDAFRSAYAMFIPGDDTMMGWMQRIVPDLILSGASAHDLVEILSSDKANSDALLPLIVALRQHTGEEIRAPAEILEVAADLRERIEAKTAKGAPVVS